MTFDIIYADPPWSYYYNARNWSIAAEKEYPTMSLEDLKKLNIKNISSKQSMLFLWSTGPKIPTAIQLMQSWGFNYRSVAFVWIKTRKDGAIIHGKGVRATATKPNAEFCLFGTVCKKGRPITLLKENAKQIYLHPPLKHSEKPPIFRQAIEEMYGNSVSKAELFARKKYTGWSVWGNEISNDFSL